MPSCLTSVVSQPKTSFLQSNLCPAIDYQRLQNFQYRYFAQKLPQTSLIPKKRIFQCSTNQLSTRVFEKQFGTRKHDTLTIPPRDKGCFHPRPCPTLIVKSTLTKTVFTDCLCFLASAYTLKPSGVVGVRWKVCCFFLKV